MAEGGGAFNVSLSPVRRLSDNTLLVGMQVACQYSRETSDAAEVGNERRLHLCVEKPCLNR